jgi:hypothetical protein
VDRARRAMFIVPAPPPLLASSAERSIHLGCLSDYAKKSEIDSTT